MPSGINRDQGSSLDIVDEAMDGSFFWNGFVVLHGIDIPLDTGMQICPNWHVVLALDAVLGFLA